MLEYQYIFWDWNGTIIDDVHVALDAVNHMLWERGYPAIDLAYYRELMDTPIIRFYEPIFDLNQYPFEEIAEEFQRLYQDRNPGPFAEVQDMLKRFCQQGRHQIVLSSSDRRGIGEVVGRLHYTQYFDEVLGADNLYAESKVKRAVQYMQQKQISPKECVLIGDTVHDYEVAEEMGIDCILLTCGHQAEEALRQCGCPVCTDHQQLEEVFGKV